MNILKKILFLSFLIISCQNVIKKEENQLKTFDLKELPMVTTLELSDLGFIDVEYVPLVTNEQSLIPRTIDVGDLLDKLIFENNYFILKQFNSILKIRDNGSFIARIGKVGRGPNEYQVCHDVEIDNKGQIYIVDGVKREIFIYSDIGEILRTIKFPLYGPVAYRFVDGMFLCYSENHLANVENSFNLIDTDGRIIKSFPNRYPFTKYPNGAYGFSHENLFYSFNNKLFKKEVYSDTIYAFENMVFKPHLVIDVGDKLITPRVRSEMAGIEIEKKYISPRNLFEFGEYIYYEFWYKFDFAKSEIYGFVGSKMNDYQVLIDPGKGLINDLDGGPNILPLTIKDDNTLVGFIDAFKLKAHVVSEDFKNSKPKYPEKKKELEKLANRLKETDNPVLIMAKLK